MNRPSPREALSRLSRLAVPWHKKSVSKHNSRGTGVPLSSRKLRRGAVPAIYATGLSRGIVAVDLDNDGDPDLAAAVNQLNAVTPMYNMGDGTFAVAADAPTGNAPIAIAQGDLDHDGDPDLVTANLSNSLSVLINTGGGAYATRRPPISSMAAARRLGWPLPTWMATALPISWRHRAAPDRRWYC